MEQDSDDAIAVVGIACKFPGANDIDEYWRVLVNGENHVTEIPKDRWDNDAFYNSDVNAPGKSYVKSAAFVDRLTEWDNRFFKISDDEAARMDPQQYLLLECTYRALENGGFPLDKLSGTNVGCYVGVMNNDYGSLIGGDVIERNNYTVTGAAVSVIANRLSYTFNLTGPSLCVDTACSSSLIAIHLGSQGIRTGDCYMAICGGVNVILDPNMFVSLCRAGMLSQSGLSQPFSDHADGYARGEGCGVVILKNLKKAIADQDRIWGIIGTGINQDGRFASPITAPSSKQQAELLQRVYCKFNIDPSEVTYIEAHGTGTRLGDPIEASSLGTYIGKARKPGAPNCLIGSVKSNIAHLESAAGVAGLIKVLLMIKNKTIAPTIHFKTPNKQINFHDLKLEVPRKAIEWVEQDSGRLACVNSFGFGGSNAHAIVREYIDTRRNQHLHEPIITISAKSKNAMKYTLQHLRKALKTNKLNIIEDLSYTSTIRRSHHHSYRLACCATSDENLCHLLEQAEKETAEKKAINIAEQKQILFLFPGMGTDWQGMGYDLFENEAIFREAIVQINDLLSEYMDQSLVDAIKKRHLVSGAMRQVAIFAIEVALHHLWSSWGVKPDAIIGHSVGEVAAAYAAGKLSLSAAVKVIFYRSQLLQKVSGGKMLALSNVTRETVNELCQAVHKPLEIAAINSNTSFTLSGDEDAIAAIERLAKEQNEKEGSDIFIHRLNVDTAFHSQQIQPICDEFKNSIDHLEQPTNGDAIDIYSTVTGKIASDDDYTDKHYWKRNLRQTVQFSKSIEAALVKDKKNIIIEVGPKPALKRYLNELTGSFDHVTLPSMLENKGQATMVKSLCKLYQLGVQIDWNAYHKYDMQIPIDLPMYQFDRKKHWHEPETSLQHRQGTAKVKRENYPFVTRVSADEMTYKCHINRSNLPFVYDHIVGGIVVVPGVLYVELALEACYSTLHLQQTRKHYCQLSIEFIRPLELVHEIDIFVRLKQDDAEIPSFSFKIVSGEISHAAGTIIVHDFRKATPLFDISETLGRCVKDIKVQQVYDFLKTFGFSYGPMMQPMTKTFKNGQEAIVLLSLPEELSNQAEGTIVHPVLFDGVLQATGVANFNTVDDDSGYKSSFPVSVGDIEIFGKPNNRVIVYVRKVHSKGYLDIFNAIVLNESGEIVIECKDIFVRVLDEDDTSRVVGKMTYELQWYEIDILDIHIKDENINNAEKKDLRALNVIFADSLGIASHLPKSITNHSQLLQYSDSKSSAINVELQKLQRFIKNARHVFYFWGISDLQYKTSSEDIFESLKSVCISLKHIVMFLAQNSATCKLIIVTLGSQCMSMISKEGDYKTEMSLHSGLTGAPLWGMVRSLLRESTYDNTVLVDLSKGTHEEVSTMVALVCGSHSPYHSEYTIFESRIYTNKLTKVSMNRDFPNKRAVWAQPESSLSVISTYPERLERLELHYEAQDKCSYPVKSVSVNVMKARLHDREFFYVTEAGVTMIKSDPWSDRNKDGYRVMIIDCICEVLSSDSCTPKHTKVHTCYPMKLCSICDVPESLLVKSSDLPKWMQNSPCLSVFVLLWEVFIKNVHEYSNKKLVIEGTNQYQNLSKLLSHCASICGFEEGSYNWQDEYEPTATDMQSVLFLYLGPITLTVSQRILKSLPTRSVLINVFHGVDRAIHNISIVRPDLEVVSINNNHIFQARHLERTLPVVVKWINEISRKSISDALTFSEFNFEQGATSTVVPSCDDELFKVLVMDPKSFVHADTDRLFDKRSCYLVVGGTKGLGLQICKYISERGGGYIAALSRSPPSYSPELSHLQSMGTQIIRLQADVADFQALSKALLHLRKTLDGIPIKGIFHGAVVLADHMLANMTDEDFAMATRPKILGAWNLHQLTENDPLDYFVMHSSIVSIFGNMGQTNYGAGNAFLDCLAHYRRLCGLPGQAINWSILNIGIIEGNEAVKKKMISMGYLPLQITDIMKCFEFALSFNTVQVAFGDFHWSKIKYNLHGYEPVHIRGRFQDFINTPEESTSQGTSSNRTGSSLDEIITEVAANVLTLEAEQVKGDMSLLELGLDSIQAITIQRHLKEKTGVLVPVTRLIDQKTTLSQISHYIDRNIRQRHVIITPEKNELEPVHPKTNIKATEDQVERFHRTLDNSKGVASNIYTIFQLHRNDTTAEYWEESLRILMKKHPMLRAVFRQAAEDIYDVTFDIHQEFKPDIRCLKAVTNGADMVAEIKKVSEIPFDLRKEYPIRIFLYMIDGKVNFVCCVVHHISCDFLSLTTLLRDLRQIMLQSLRADETERFEFFDFLKRRRELLKSQGKILKKFWAGVFRSSLDFLPGRYSLMIQAPKSSPAYQTEWSIETGDLTQLNSLARTSGLTLFQIVTAVYAILLKIYSKSNDVLITYPVDMRIHVPVSHDAVGYFINIVPLRVTFGGMTASINDFLKEVGNMIKSGTDHCLYPLTKIEQCVRIDGIGKPPCLTQHTITLEDHSAFREIGQYDKIDGIENVGGGIAHIRQMTLIEIIKSTEMDTMLFKCSFNESYFERDDAIRFCDDYKHLMKMCVRNPYMTLADLISKFQSE